jgi:hypothetical protein
MEIKNAAIMKINLTPMLSCSSSSSSESEVNIGNKRAGRNVVASEISAVDGWASKRKREVSIEIYIAAHGAYSP